MARLSVINLFKETNVYIRKNTLTSQAQSNIPLLLKPSSSQTTSSPAPKRVILTSLERLSAFPFSVGNTARHLCWASWIFRVVSVILCSKVLLNIHGRDAGPHTHIQLLPLHFVTLGLLSSSRMRDDSSNSSIRSGRDFLLI